MPIARIQLEDGRIARVEVPEGTTPEQALTFVKQQTAQETPSGFARGLMDPISGAAELLSEMVPEPVEQFVNRVNNKLVDIGVPLARIPEGGQRALNQQQERAYQQARQAAGETGIDWDRIGGNIVSPANLMAASKGVQLGAKAAQRIGAGAKGTQYAGATGAGIGSAALMPTSEGDFSTEKLKQLGVGAGSGVAGQLGANALSRVIRPERSAEVTGLLEQGITPTPGQALGGMWNKVEQQLMSVPGIGNVIEAGRNRAINQLNRAAFQRAVGPVGVKVTKDVPLGEDGVKWVRDTLRAKYDEVVPNLSGGFDAQFNNELAQLTNMAHRLKPDNVRKFYQVLEQDVIDKATTSGKFSGETWKRMEESLGKEWRKAAKSLDPDDRDFSDAVRQLQSNLRDLAARQNPQYAAELRKINRGWAEYDLIAQASEYAGALRNQQMSPANLRAAMKRKSTRRNQTATGGGLGQKGLYGPAERVLGPNVPDSGTAGRLITGALGAGAAAGGLPVGPALLPMAATSLPYLPGAQFLATSALMRRPEIAQPIAEFIRKSAPFAIPGLNPMAQGFLGTGPQR